MPVDHRTVQPFRLLHGGASVVLAETLGSVASNALVHEEGQMAVGLAINANHLASAKEGSVVTGIAQAVHVGRSTHVWDIKITDEHDKLLCVSRLTVAIKKTKETK